MPPFFALHTQTRTLPSLMSPFSPPARTPIAATLQRHPRLTLAFLLILYAAMVAAIATIKLFWFDELVTLHIARLGSPSAIWHALALGTDPNPPFTHLAVLTSTTLFGLSTIAVRLPSILAVFIALISLWIFLRRRLPVLWTAAGLLFFMSTRGFDYAYDARSYAFLLGSSMAALALWTASLDRPRSWAAPLGIAAALAIGLSSNYYGVIAFFPIAIGETIRSLQLRKFNPRIWLALAVGALPLPFYLPLIRTGIATYAPHAWNKTNPSILFFAYAEIVEFIFWPILALALAAAIKHSVKHPGTRNKTTGALDQYPGGLGEDLGGPSFAPSAKGGLRSVNSPTIVSRLSGMKDVPHHPHLPLHELAAIATLILYPFLGYLIAIAGAGMISPRSVVPVCLGCAILAAHACSRLFAINGRVAPLILATLFVFATARQYACGLVLHQQRKAFFSIRDSLPTTGPIVVSDSLITLPLDYYATPQLRSRLIFPLDFDIIHRFQLDDSGERNLWAGRTTAFTARIIPYSALNIDQPLTIIAPDDRTDWLLYTLASHRVALTPQPRPAAWDQLDGVFTSLAHNDARIFTSSGIIKP